MLDRFLETAKADEPVFITDVRESFLKEGKRPFHLHIRLYDDSVRRFEMLLPETGIDEEKAFVASYVFAMIYNILSSLGAVTIEVYIDPEDEDAAALAKDLDRVFQSAGRFLNDVGLHIPADGLDFRRKVKPLVLAENPGPDEVRTSLFFPETLENGAVQADWTTMPYGVIDEEGTILEAEKDEGTLVQIQCILTCQGEETDFTFAVKVFPGRGHSNHAPGPDHTCFSEYLCGNGWKNPPSGGKTGKSAGSGLSRSDVEAGHADRGRTDHEIRIPTDWGTVPQEPV